MEVGPKKVCECDRGYSGQSCSFKVRGFDDTTYFRLDIFEKVKDVLIEFKTVQTVGN